ncbi:Alstrom syndrome protein 1 homolog [Xenopus tropicalis]|uniref:Alstrom syndrome protein 1 homolog n=1 Tax=Xenopus tropicalis TaxID=8364 RepID=A0A8J1JQV5_XENTR|nr:Alstrom syndrome protein 1 homolog [Xenopus tropicalis]
MPASHPAAAAASPARKAISCVHVQISPKQEDSKKLDFDPKLLSGSACVNNVAKLQEPDLSPSRAANLPGKEGALIKQDLADEKLTLSSLHLHTNPSDSGIRPPVSSLSTPESAASVVLGRIPLHDATTQITMESTAKTTFSAEIFIDSREKDIISRSPDVTANTTPERQPLYHARLSPATDQPLLVPYRPHGSPELFYVPYTDGLSRISPVSTIESSHTGSNDAVSPKFPVEVLGSGMDSLSDSALVRHKEGIYSKGSSPKLAWEASTAPHKGNASETLPTRSAVRHTLEKEPEHQMGSDTKAPRTALTQGNFQYERDSRLDNQRERPSLLSSHTEDNEFFPLTPEIDFNRDQRRDGSPSLRWNSPAEGSLLRNAKTISFPFSKSSPSLKVTGSSPLPGKVSPTSLGGRSVTNGRNGENSYTNGRYMSVTRESDGHKRLHKSQATLDQSSVSQQRWHNSVFLSAGQHYSSLDDLWARYTNRKKLQQSESKSNHELSLVERLDRLARLLHNSSSHSPHSAKDEPLADLEQSKNHVKERSWEGSGHKGERWYDKKLSGTGLHVGGRYSLDEIDITSHADESSVGSDLYPLLQSAKSDSAPSETGTATQTGSEVTTQTSESSSTLKTVSSSVSTIDTIRLINAFGPERVCPSSRLSRLYSAIDLQKRRSEESTGKPSRNPAARIDTGGLHRSLNKESLKTHRPDFIFRSGERVKRLHLIAEERKLQTVFQSEREKLFNQPAKAGEWETAQQQLQDYRLNQKNRMIPKKEMVQHSKRIYEQLPEVKKRREAEKRRQEYESYRLKAQLFRKLN